MEFFWVGNHPGVDLCNTVPVVAGEAVELLATPTDLQRWLLRADPSAADRIPDGPTLEWVRTVREALRAVLTAGGPRDAPIRKLNNLLAQVTAVPQVDAEGQLRLHPAKETDQLRLAVASLAIAACALPPSRVRECANPKCVLLFYDSSKNATRRWHDMTTCGNQAKAAAHHERQRTRTDRTRPN